MPRFSRKQIIAIILKKKGALSGLLKRSGAGIHQVTPEPKMHRFLRVYLSTAPVESVIRNPKPGIHDSWVVRLKGGQKAIFKEESANKELLAYEVDRIMGFNRVPVVAPRTLSVPWGRGAVAEFTGIMMQWSKQSRRVRGADLDSLDVRSAFHEMRMFDYIIGNTDRNVGNYLVAGHGKQKIIPIDHGRAFRAQPDPVDFFSGYEFSESLYELPIEARKALLPKLDRLLRREGRLRSLHAGDTLNLGGIDKEKVVGDMMKRARFLKRYIQEYKLDTETPIPLDLAWEERFSRARRGL